MEPNQPSLFDLIDRAIAQADGNADERWKEVALDCVRKAAHRSDEITADDVVELLERESVTTHNLSALGPVFQRAAKAGWISNTNRMVQSRILRRHRKITVWESLVNAKHEMECA